MSNWTMTPAEDKMYLARKQLYEKNSWVPHFIRAWIQDASCSTVVKFNKGHIELRWNPSEISNKRTVEEVVKMLEEKAHSFCSSTIIRGNMVKRLRERASLQEVKK